MPIRPIESGPLTSREIKELDGFLLAEDGLENPMDFSEWLRWVWDQEQGEQPPEFKSEKQAKRILSLLIGHANVLAFTLIHGLQYYEPRFYAHKIEGKQRARHRRVGAAVTSKASRSILRAGTCSLTRAA